MSQVHQLYKEAEKSEAEACAWVFAQAGGQPKLHYHKLPPLLANNVRVEVRFFSIHTYDALQVAGHFGELKRLPFCPGLQAVGVVEKAGPTSKRKKGDVVVVSPIRSSCKECSACKDEQNHLCRSKVLLGDPSSMHFGAYSTHIQVDEDCLLNIP